MSILTRIATIRRLFGLIAACCLLVSSSVYAEEPTNTVGEQQVVLLKNTRCLTGAVRRVGDQVVIETAGGIKITQRASDVEFIGKDLEDVYQYKIKRFTRLGSGEHFQLTRWSLSVGLNAHAAEHYLELNKLAGDHPSVRQLGIEVREQLLKDDQFRNYLGMPSVAAAAQQAESSKVQPASTDHVEEQVIHPSVVTMFSRQVQPVMLNRCGQSGCHGMSTTTQLKILQPLGSGNARITEQNCRSAANFLQTDETQLSLLVRKAITAHGMQKTPAITSQETRLIEMLQSWTDFARAPVVTAGGSSTANSAAIPAVYAPQSPVSGSSVRPLQPVAPGSAGLQQVPRAENGSASGPRSPAFALPPGESGPLASELDALDAEIRRALGEPPYVPNPAAPSSTHLNVGADKPITPAGKSDPFDPAEFNRQARRSPQP